MSRFLSSLALLVIAAAAGVFVAGQLRSLNFGWAYDVCNSVYGFCDRTISLVAIAGAAGCVYLPLKAVPDRN